MFKGTENRFVNSWWNLEHLESADLRQGQYTGNDTRLQGNIVDCVMITAKFN